MSDFDQKVLRVPRIPNLPPAAPVNRPQTRAAPPAPVAAEPGSANRQKWRDAQKELENGSEHLVAAALPQGGGNEDSEGEDDARDDKQASAAPLIEVKSRLRPEMRGVFTSSRVEDAEAVPNEIIHLGRLISAFASHAMTQDAWAARVPLSNKILADTVLHLHCAQSVLSLRFETTDWASRHLIQRHSQALLTSLKDTLPMMLEIYLAPE